MFLTLEFVGQHWWEMGEFQWLLRATRRESGPPSLRISTDNITLTMRRDSRGIALGIHRFSPFYIPDSRVQVHVIRGPRRPWLLSSGVDSWHQGGRGVVPSSNSQRFSIKGDLHLYSQIPESLVEGHPKKRPKIFGNPHPSHFPGGIPNSSEAARWEFGVALIGCRVRSELVVLNFWTNVYEI